MENKKYIDADAVVAHLKELQKQPLVGYGEYELLETIKNAPAINPQTLRPVAHWNGQYDGYFDGEPVCDVWECSNCGHIIDDGTDCEDDLPRYCPSCGAKMEDDDA